MPNTTPNPDITKAFDDNVKKACDPTVISPHASVLGGFLIAALHGAKNMIDGVEACPPGAEPLYGAKSQQQIADILSAAPKQ